ncbi:hypothetical protein ABBQ32_006175 [Trebouxia sp. C0010 RCD-2024]
MAQSRLAAQDQLHNTGADAVPSDPALAGATDQELKLAMELSEAEAKQAAKGKRVLHLTPSEEDLERVLQESANLASSGPHKQPPYAYHSGEGSSAMEPDQDASDAELARALYESEQLAYAGPAQTAEAPERASAPMLQSPLQPPNTHQNTDATTSTSSPSMSQTCTAHGWSTHLQPASDSTVRYPEVYQPGGSSSHTSPHQYSPQQQTPQQELHTHQQGAGQQQSPISGQSMPQQREQRSCLPTQLQGSTRQQQQLAPGHRLPPLQPQHQHGLAQPAAGASGPGPYPKGHRLPPLQPQHQHSLAQPAGGTSGSGPYLDGYHGSASQESMLTGDEAFAKALQEEEYKAAVSAVGTHAPSAANSSRHQQPGQAQGQDASKCPGCGHRLTHRTVVVSGQAWHPDCFKCTACQRPIPAGQKYGIGAGDHQPYHMQCYSEKFDPRCMVCHDLIPKQGNTIPYQYDPFWRSKWCPAHSSDGTLKCCACSRLQPRGEEWVTELDGRTVCLDCLSTLVRDTADAQPLYDQILRFYHHKGMALPEEPPLMLVETSALNAAEEKEGRSGTGHDHGPVFHTRGLTLTVEYKYIQHVTTRDGRQITQPVDLSARSRYEVTAILVLHGLPWLLTGTILAHECMHAWLRFRGITQLPLQTEEGLCQLMGLLWLESQDLSKQQGSWEERLASYFAHQIRTDPTSVYGDGFKLALEAYQDSDLPTVIAHAERTGRFPSC